jgi:hypothetical protein
MIINDTDTVIVAQRNQFRLYYLLTDCYDGQNLFRTG